MIRRIPHCMLVMILGSLTGPAQAQEEAYNREPIRYLDAEATNPITRLQGRIDDGEVRLKRDRKWGYLPAVLDALGVPEESQMLVFSKTSFQASRISPVTPRAIYFADDVYVGWVPGGDVLEISAVDPDLGVVFYLLGQEPAPKPVFERQTHACLSCHASGKTQGVPGHLVRSVYAKADGMPAYNAGSFVTGHESPMRERWGGWFVTGTHGASRHMGNVFVRNSANPEDLDRDAGSNVTDLSDRLSVAMFLEPTSDLVALMVLEHQTQLHNRITAAGFATRQALEYQRGINESLKLPADEVWDSTRKRIEGPAEELLRYLLFSEEAALEAPVAGTSGFAEVFQARGPKDEKGRSLRDLDLTTRLQRYRCSYLIDSDAFRSLPDQTKQHVYKRLDQVLSGEDRSEAFAHLGEDERLAIREILAQTHPELKEHWSGRGGMEAESATNAD